MSNRNNITGDVLVSKIGNKTAFDAGYDQIIFDREKTMPERPTGATYSDLPTANPEPELKE